METKDIVCAVVVTYNRKELLLECLKALRKQTRPIQGIYLIDNASTDGTPELLLKEGYIKELPPKNPNQPWEKEFDIKDLTNESFIKLHYVRMHKNTGGAGGFYEGVKRAYEKGYHWLWLMDDDTVPSSNALLELLRIKELEPAENIGFVCSKVLWVDDTPHLMNLPQIKPLISGVPFNKYEREGFLRVEAASFVSLLIRSDVVKTVGYPIKEFFIWGDDIEYTARISTYFSGFYCSRSLVVHKTKENYSANDICDWRLYYNTRNNLYILKNRSKIRFLYILLKSIFKTFRLPFQYWKTNLKACIDSLVFNPQIVYPKGVMRK